MKKLNAVLLYHLPENNTIGGNRKMKSRFYKCADIMRLMECGKSYAYKLIAQWNAELAEQNFATFPGKIPKAYADSKMLR